MFPLKVDAPLRRMPVLTVLLMLACVAAFIAQRHLVHYGEGFVPLDFMYALLHPGRRTADALMNLGAAFFLHAGWLHLVSNLWYLWLFGAALENQAGSGAFALFYALGGVVAMLTQVLSSPCSPIPVVGASGAIAAVMGAFTLLLPMARIIVWIPIFFIVRVPAVFFLLLWFALQYLSMRYAPQHGGGVAWWAHMGGFVCGLLLAVPLRLRPAASSRRGRPAAARGAA